MKRSAICLASGTFRSTLVPKVAKAVGTARVREVRLVLTEFNLVAAIAGGGAR
jgi:hypothetical protein